MLLRLALLTAVLTFAGVARPGTLPQPSSGPGASSTSVAFTGEAFRSAIENAMFTIERFTARGGRLIAVGIVSGDVYFVGGPCVDAGGSSVRCHLYERSFSGVSFEWPVAGVSRSCSSINVRLARVGGGFDPRPWGDRWLFPAKSVRLAAGSTATCAAATAISRDSVQRLDVLLSRLV